MKRFWKSQKGESLVAVTMAIGVAAMVATTMATQQVNQAKTARFAAIKDEMLDLRKFWGHAPLRPWDLANKIYPTIDPLETLLQNNINTQTRITNRCQTTQAAGQPDPLVTNANRFLQPYRKNSVGPSTALLTGPKNLDGSFQIGNSKWWVRVTCAQNYVGGLATLVVRVAMKDGTNTPIFEPINKRFQYSFTYAKGFMIPENGSGGITNDLWITPAEYAALPP